MSTLARVVFALLIAATFGAFFVAQRLKSAESVAEYTQLKRFFSPNGDGRRDVDRISFKVKEADEVTVTVVDRDGERVRRLGSGIDARPDRDVTVVWDGKTDAGARAPDGLYRMQLGSRRTGRTVDDRRLVRGRHDRADARRALGHAADRGADARQLRDPRPRRRPPPRAALPGAADRRGARQGGRALRRPQGQPPRRLGRPGGRRACPARHLHGRRAGARPLRQRRHRARRAPAGPRPGPREARHHRAPDRRAAAGRAGARRRAGPVLRRLAPALLSLERPPRRRVAADQEGHRGAGEDAQHARAARHLGRLPAAGPLRPLQHERAVPRPGAGAREAARGRAGDDVARRRQGRRRRRRAAQHARARRAGEVAAGDQRRPGDPARVRARRPRRCWSSSTARGSATT